MIAKRFKFTALLIALCAATPALAQGTVYGKDCNPVPTGSDEAFEINICRTHVACDIAYRAASVGCTTQNFLDKVSDAFSTKGKIEADDVEQAAKPDGADTLTPSMRNHASTMTAQERAEDHDRQLRNTNAANDMDPATASDLTVLPPKRPGGYISVFEGSGTAKDGKGTLIGEDGITKGTFKDGVLQGEGEQILSDGTYRGGTYKDGQIAGKGFEFGEKNGKSFVTEGNFKADQPDGLATVTYDDKSSERVLWANGKIVSRGQRAPAGTTPFDPKPMSDEALAIAGQQPTDYVKGNLVNGTGMIERIRLDGTAQFEEWEDGKLVQVGVRKPVGEALAPQQRPKAAPHPFGGNGPATPPEEPRVATSPEPCRNERMQWAAYSGGGLRATLEGMTTQAARQDRFLDEAKSVSGAGELVFLSQQRGDPMKDLDFLRQFIPLAHRTMGLAQQSADSFAAQGNRDYFSNAAGYVWVACMAEHMAAILQAPPKSAVGAQMEPQGPRSPEGPRAGASAAKDSCEPEFVAFRQEYPNSDNDSYFVALRSAVSDEQRLILFGQHSDTAQGFMQKPINPTTMRQMADALTAFIVYDPRDRGQLSWGACVARRLADTLEARR